MSNQTQDNLTLEFREESVSNVIYEESASFGRSISNEAYLKAFQITQTILSINDRYQDKGKKDGTAIRNRGQFFNIIAFTGGRGTGKTSVMLSYMEFLKDYYRNLHSKEVNSKLGELRFQNIDSRKECELMFTGLEHIDASLLGSRSDDVLRNILPKMLKKWHDEEERSYRDSGIVRDEDYAYKKRHIQMLFNNVYKSLRDLNRKEDILESDNDMFMETLENLSLTWNLRQSFQKLVEAYLEIMEYPGSEGKIHLNNHFLVISLDDLDMNIDHGFDLLEEVRKYLMVPNVIVLLTASYEQLERLCIEHYTRAFKETKGENGTKEYIARLAREYLEKILPSHCQVMLEPVYKWKAYEQGKVSIKYTELCNKEYSVGPQSLKTIIQQQFIQYFEMKYREKGICLSYLIPNTIRELALWIRQVYSLETLKYSLDDKQKNIVCKKNLQWFLKNRLMPLYEKYLDTKAETIEQLEPKGQTLTIKEMFQEDDEKSLLEILSENLRKTREDQEKAALSVIYFTVKLTELFITWYDGDNASPGSQAVYYIEQYFDNGIWGKWEKELMCQCITSRTSSAYDIARIEFGRLSKCLDHHLAGTFTVNNNKEKEKFVMKNQRMLKNYQLLLQFFDFPADFSFEGLMLAREGENYCLKLKAEDCNGGFALSNIMCPWKDKGKVLEDFQNNLLKALGTDRTKQLGKNLLELFAIEETEGNYIIIPAENIEYLIHVGRKLQNQFGSSRIEKKASLIREKLREYFTLIRESLKEYDDMYKTHYEDDFNKTQIGEELKKSFEGKEISGENLLDMLALTIERVAVPRTYILMD